MDIQHTGVIATEEIYEDICNKIEELEYMPGAKLSENELCKVYGVSRHVIRNVLTRLKQRRLVDVYPQRGTFVSLIDMNYIQDILYLRESVEQEALYRVMQKENRVDVAAEMRKMLAVQKKLYDMGEYKEEFIRVDNAFHGILLKNVGEENVMNFIAEPYIHIRRWRNFEVRTTERLEGILREHEQLVDAIESGDAKLARDILNEHLDTVNKFSLPFKETEAQYFIFKNEE